MWTHFHKTAYQPNAAVTCLLNNLPTPDKQGKPATADTFFFRKGSSSVPTLLQLCSKDGNLFQSQS